MPQIPQDFSWQRQIEIIKRHMDTHINWKTAAKKAANRVGVKEKFYYNTQEIIFQ